MKNVYDCIRYTVNFLFTPNAADERASFCVLDPFVIAPLFSLFCATNTGLLHSKLCSFVLSAALSQTQQFLYLLFPLSYFFLRSGEALCVVYAYLRVFLRRYFIVFIYLRSGGALAAYAHCLR
jgi:hypothetical protein